MYNILTLNKIAAIGTSRLGDNYKYGDDVQNPDAVLVRSAAMHDMEFADNLLAIARAGAGTNNIPKDKCSEQGIVVFNTPGANANAVKELVIAGLLISNRKVIEGYEWAKTLKGNGAAVGKMVEKGKSQFVGPEIKGKTLGVIGLGAIGILVANAAVALGMNVIGFDPFMSVGNALKLAPTVKLQKSAEEVMVNCDYLTIQQLFLRLLRAARLPSMLQTSEQTISSVKRILSASHTSVHQLPKVKKIVLLWLVIRLRSTSRTVTSSTP